MKVAILSPYPTFPFAEKLGCERVSYDGNATWTVALATHLAALPNTAVHVVTEAIDIPRSQTIIDQNVTIHFLKAPKRFKTLSFYQFDRLRIHRALKEIRPDIVHGQGVENPYGYAAVTSPYPNVLTIHGIPHLAQRALQNRRYSRGKFVRFMSHVCLKKARNIIVINPFVQESYHLRCDHYRLFPIPNALGQQFFEAPPRPRESDLILAIGAVYRLKGQDILLKALILLRQRGIKVRAMIVGPAPDAEYLSSLQNLIREGNLDVQFAGFLSPERTLSHLQSCTMLVLPSRFDTSPMVVGEAMATATPVIASRVAGLPNMIRDGDTGLLFEPENFTELADKIQSLLGDESARKTLAEKAARYARETYHPDRVAELTRAAYEQVLEGSA